MINEATIADRRWIHTPVIYKTKKEKNLKLRVSLVYLGFTREAEKFLLCSISTKRRERIEQNLQKNHT